MKVLYNLISNSIKYRKVTDAPIIEIKSRKKNNVIFLIFKDNS
jgi:signal transduction histidine kinase